MLSRIFLKIGLKGRVKHYVVGPPRFELESPAPEAGRMPSYPTAPMRLYTQDYVDYHNKRFAGYVLR